MCGLINGEQSLVKPSIYQKYRHVTASVLSRVRLMKSKKPWVFFCLTSGAYSMPRWVFMNADESKPTMDLDEIVANLREHLLSICMGTADAWKDDPPTPPMFLARVREDKSRAASKLNYGNECGFFWEGKAEKSRNLLISRGI